MGQTYLVELELKIKDRQKVEEKLSYLVRKYTGRDRELDLDRAIKFFLTDSVAKTDEGSYNSAFDGSYGWNGLLDEMFKEIAKWLDNGSYIRVWPDNGNWVDQIVGDKLVEIIND